MPTPHVRSRGAPSIRARALAVLAFAIAELAVGTASAARPVTVVPSGASRPPPLSPLRVVTPFRSPASLYDAGHRGVDLAGTAGQPVVATVAGRVSFAGPVAGVGVVSVDIGSGQRLTYEPVAPMVSAGAELRPGDPLGTLVDGHAGCATACLHWGLVVADGPPRRYANPLALLGAGEVRLLPWEGEPR